MSADMMPAQSARFEHQSRLAYGAAVTAMAADDDTVVAVSADTVDLMGLREMANRWPQRVIEAGIAEQNAMGIASGLATTGLRPFVSGYAPFIAARSMEQVRNDVAYAGQRVVIGAACSGIALGVSGGTHHALEDLAVMQSMPGMTVLVPADASQAWHLARAAGSLDGPVYLRLGGRAAESPVTEPGVAPRVGRADCLRDGSDVTVIACGCLVAPAIEAADTLAAEGVHVRVLNMHTIKPLDRNAVLAAAQQTAGIVTAEEHHLTGGLGAAVAQVLALEHPAPMRFVAMPDQFAVVGPTDRVRARYGLDAANIVAQCRDILNQ